MDNSHDPREQQLYRTQRAEIVGQLAGGISHDFNNRLNGIIGSANIVRMRTDDDNVKRAATDIVGICRSAGAVIKDLLNIARDKPITVMPISAHDAINAAVNLLECALSKKIVFKKALDAKHCRVMADAVQLQCALLDLALKAKNAMPEEGGALIFSTENIDDVGDIEIPENIEPHGAILITISDTECGAAATVTLPVV